MEVSTTAEVGNALREKADTIEMAIESGAGKAVHKIKGTGHLAWIACFGGVGVAVVGMLAPIGKARVVTTTLGLAPAALFLGVPIATGAIAIAVAGGGMGALSRLRGYKMEKTDAQIILRKK